MGRSRIPGWVTLILYGLLILYEGIVKNMLFPFAVCAALLFVIAGAAAGVDKYHNSNSMRIQLWTLILIILGGLCLLINCRTQYNALFLIMGAVATLISLFGFFLRLLVALGTRQAKRQGSRQGDGSSVLTESKEGDEIPTNDEIDK